MSGLHYHGSLEDFVDEFRKVKTHILFSPQGYSGEPSQKSLLELSKFERNMDVTLNYQQMYKTTTTKIKLVVALKQMQTLLC